MIKFLKKSASFLKRILGFVEIREISPGESYDSGRFYSIYALGGELTFDVTTSKGDDLTGVSIQRDATFQGTFESISVDGASSGSAIIYLN